MDFELPSSDEVRRVIFNSLSKEEMELIKNGKEKIDYEKIEAYYDILRKVEECCEEGQFSIRNGLFEPFPLSGFIMLTGNELTFSDIDDVKEALQKASNIEITKYGDGEVGVILTFNGVKTKVLE